MATKREHELADKMIKMLKDYGYSYEEMPEIFRMARGKFKLIKSRKL